MLLIGDTAQCIMYGISFRFSDLKSLFYGAQLECERHIQEKARLLNKRIPPQQMRRFVVQQVRIPSCIHQLDINYRSHNGILRMASALIDILVTFFPESIDRLKRDKGTYDKT